MYKGISRKKFASGNLRLSLGVEASVSKKEKSMSEVTYYGADWCSDCRRSKSLMNTLGVEFDEKNVEESAALAAEAEGIAGRKNIPVIVFKDGTHLVEPSDAILHAELKVRGLI
jgi:glutaredoxin